jgi:hypothetical protein
VLEEDDMQSVYGAAMLFEARQHELEEQARHQRLVAQARRRPKPRPRARNRSWRRPRTLWLAARIGLDMERPA